MADTVDTQVLFNGTRRYVVRLTNISDGTGESAVVKIDKSTLTNGNGTEPGKLSIVEAQWAIQGFASIRLLWDHTTDDEAMVLDGNGFRDFSDTGGLPDPGTAGGTGDLILTTNGAVSGATYDIYVILLKGN